VLLEILTASLDKTTEKKYSLHLSVVITKNFIGLNKTCPQQWQMYDVRKIYEYTSDFTFVNKTIFFSSKFL
jgi:hypothetical protein